MAAIKRKAEEKISAGKKTAVSGGDRAAKRPRQEEGPAAKPGKSGVSEAEATTQKTVPKTSILQQEEKSFPRGGGSVLTPLEHKQIQIQATRDVLFEESGQKRPTNGLEDGEDGDVFDDVAPAEEEKAAKKRKKNAKMSKAPVAEKAEKRIKVEGLKYKRLAPGSMILGQITRITPQELVLDLPNNLTGIVPITNISRDLTRKLEALANGDEEEKDEDETKAEQNDADLKDYFRVGQYLRTRVISVTDTSQGADSTTARKRIELTLEPQAVNQGMSSADICPNCMLQASVKSVEDHGLIMDLGMEDGSVNGFLPKKELPGRLDVASVREGAVFLCSASRLEKNGKVVRLSAKISHPGDVNNVGVLQKAPTVNSILPGAVVELLVSQLSATSIFGQVMGMVSASADIVHSGASAANKDLESKYKIGDKVKARVIFMLTEGDNNTFGLSLIDHMLTLSMREAAKGKSPVEVVPLSSVVEKANIVSVEPGLGLYVDVGVKGVLGFVHISRVSDTRVESLSKDTGPFRPGTNHKARIIGYNAIDGMFLVSLEKTVLESPFIRIEDVPIGGLVRVKVEKIVVKAAGVAGILVNLAPGISGLVPEMHMSDIHLQFPEKKYKAGISVSARVLSTDIAKHQIRLTLKKSLVNSDAALWKTYSAITPGDASIGTILTLSAQGALVQFYGAVRAFLPVSQMSDAYIQDPTQHFRIGQVVNVHALSVDPAAGRMTVSCKLPRNAEDGQDAAFAQIKVGDLVSGKIVAHSAEDISIDLQSGLRGTLPIGHLTDGDEEKNTSALKRMKEGKSLQDLVILDIFAKKRSVTLSAKPSLIRAAKSGDLIKSFDEVVKDKLVHGFVRNITPDAVFVQYAGGVTGLLHRTQVSEDLSKRPGFGLRKDQSVAAKVLKIDNASQRFFLSLKEPEQKSTPASAGEDGQIIINPVDGKATSLADFAMGKTSSAQIASIKNSQLNVKLADNFQGRIDVSEAFASIDDINDYKNPLASFKPGQILPVKVLGMHDARSHRFLPISHRGGKVPVFELSTKLGAEESIASLDQLKVDSWYTGFVNGISELCLWVNLSPNIRGRIDRIQISEDVSVLNDLESNFPVGSAIRVRVTAIDSANQRLDLSARAASTTALLSFEDVKPGMIATGRVTKATERSILVQLSGNVSGHVGLTELTDDFGDANPTIHDKNAVVRVCVLDVDKSNKKISLSTRPSKVLSSSLPVKDRSIASIEQLKEGDVVRGFVKNVADIGIFVTLSYNVTAFVRVSELSDAYVKDWKADFEVDKLVTGKITTIDSTSKNVQMSLKPSVVSADYVPLLSFNDLKVGDVITGKIRKVEEFGVFIVVDGSHNVSGLCHKSEIADQRVHDVKKLFDEGDAVKAIVLKVEPEKRRISFGLKASYFKEGNEDEDEEDEDSDDRGVDLEVDDEDAEDVDIDGGVELESEDELADANEDGEEEEEEGDDEDVEADGLNDTKMTNGETTTNNASGGLDAGGFDWTGSMPMDTDTVPATNELDASATRKKKKNKPEIKADLTGELDLHGPRSTSDFERLLLSQRDNSSLWVQYMAFQLELNEIEEARKIAERALREINIREQEEKMNVWIAYLNLENAFGTDESLEEIFNRACQVQDPKEVSERLTSIYIQSNKMQKADELFQTMTSRKSFTPDPKLWLNYARFLFDSVTPPSPTRARALLQRAMQSVPGHLHRELVTSFATLEYKCTNGDSERGRTMFEGLVDTYPKRPDLWDVRVQLETSKGEPGVVRELYERMSALPMKKRRANYVFKRWLEFEEKQGDKKQVERVKGKARDWVEKHAGKGDDE